MKTKLTSAEALLIALLLAPFVYLALILHQLPAEIATHFGLNGYPDGWQRKETTVLIMGGMAVALYALLRYLPRFDPKGRLQTSNYQKLRVVVTGFFAAVTGWLFYTAAHPANGGPGQNVNVVLALSGLMLAGMGNYLTTLKPNYFVGIRTPWTLESETVWRRTHRLGGRLLVAAGLLAALLALVVPMPYTTGAVMVVIGLAALVPVAYSYVYYRQEKAGQFN